jgi:hypothetical protein
LKTAPTPDGLKDIQKNIMISEILIEICRIKNGFVNFQEIYKIYDRLFDECIVNLDDCMPILKDIDKYTQIVGIKNSFTSICNSWINIRNELKIQSESSEKHHDSSLFIQQSQITHFNQQINFLKNLQPFQQQNFSK